LCVRSGDPIKLDVAGDAQLIVGLVDHLDDIVTSTATRWDGRIGVCSRHEPGKSHGQEDPHGETAREESVSVYHLFSFHGPAVVAAGPTVVPWVV
jgi:hypothetical protein